MTYNMTGNGGSMLLVFALGIFWIIYVIAMAVLCFVLICYVYLAMGVYAIAKRRNLECPWLAWIPVLNMWSIGRVAEHFYKLKNDKKAHFAPMLLLSYLINLCLTLGIFANLFYIAPTAGTYYSNISGNVYPINPALAIVVLVFAVLFLVIYYRTVYYVFESLKPRCGAALLIPSVIFGVSPFIIFGMRNKDNDIIKSQLS